MNYFTYILPLPLTFWPIPYAVLFWAIYLWCRQGEHKIMARDRLNTTPQSRDDERSWALINYGTKTAKVVALLAAFITPAIAEGQARIECYFFGLVLMIAGAGLRRYCFRKLGEYFTFQVRVSETNKVIKQGLYKWVRHPSYTGGTIYNLGIGFALTNWISVFLLGLAIIVSYVYRVRIEEAALVRAHGNEYSDYMKQTKRFVPFVI